MKKSLSSSKVANRYCRIAPVLGLVLFIAVIALHDLNNKESFVLPQRVEINPSFKDYTYHSKGHKDASSDRNSLFAYGIQTPPNLESSVHAITARVKPRRLQLQSGDQNTATPHQILHLHNMKTGGTSIDRRLNCAIKRLGADYNVTIPRYSIHECWRRVYRECVENSTNPCRLDMHNAAVMSFCGPLEMVEKLGWAGPKRPEVAVVTMLRHPVDRGKLAL